MDANNFCDALKEVVGGQDSAGADETGNLREKGEKCKEVGQAGEAGEKPESGGKVHS